jgi:3-methylcrotonyl-CoA carboxylase alpha subunit
VRVDSGIRSGDTVSVHYDPMIAKIVAEGADRTQAITRLRHALAATEIAGLPTNLALLQAILDEPEFRAGAVDTGFIARHADTLLKPAGAVPMRALALAALATLRAGERDAPTQASDPHSPWVRLPGWRLNRDAYADLLFRDGETTLAVRARYRNGDYVLDLPDGPRAAAADLAADGAITARLGNIVCTGRVLRHADDIFVFTDGQSHRLIAIDPRRPAPGGVVADGKIVAPMPGTLTKVAVAIGDTVVKGAVLAVVEAMKMEHAVLAPRPGKVREVRFAAGDLVPEGAELVVLEAAE